MSTNFPTSIDVLTNPVAGDALDSVTVPHASQHTDLNDAVEAIETQIGTTSVPVLARLAGPTFTGVPSAPTAAPLTNTTQIATTAFVISAANTGPQGSQGAQGSTGSISSFGYVSGFYYRGASSRSFTTPLLNVTNYFPLRITKTNTFDRIAIETTSSHVGTCSVRLGIYNNDDTTGKPTTVLLDAGTVSCTTLSTVFQITISQSLSVGNYWVAFNMQTAPTTPRFFGATTAFASPLGLSVSTNGFATDAGCWSEAGVTGAFTTAGTLTSIGLCATAMLRST